MPPKRGTNKTDPRLKPATVTSPRPSAKDDSAEGPWQDDAVLSVLSDDAARKAKLRARHSGTPLLDEEPRDYLRFRASGLQKPTPTRKQTPTQSAKPSGAKSGTAGRKASSSQKGTPDEQMRVLTARLNAALEATTLGQEGSIKTVRELGLPRPISKAGDKSAGAKSVNLGLKGGAKPPAQGNTQAKPRSKPPTAGGTGGRPLAKQLGGQSPKPSGFRFGAKPVTPTGEQLPAIAGISSLPKEQAEQNTPASRVDQSLNSERAADWSGLDAVKPKPPPKPVSLKTKPMCLPTGVTAKKAGGSQDKLTSKTAQAKAAKKVNKTAFWQEAYEHMLRADTISAQHVRLCSQAERVRRM